MTEILLFGLLGYIAMTVTIINVRGIRRGE